MSNKNQSTQILGAALFNLSVVVFLLTAIGNVAAMLEGANIFMAFEIVNILLGVPLLLSGAFLMVKSEISIEEYRELNNIFLEMLKIVFSLFRKEKA